MNRPHDAERLADRPERRVTGCDVGQIAGAPCPVCDAPLMQEHAHTRCRACGWLGKCCE